jgi:hypothetical protein
MATLNAGQHREDKISTEDRDLISEFIRTKGVQKLQPAELDGSEISRSTHDRIVEARRVFRENKRKTKNT